MFTILEEKTVPILLVEATLGYPWTGTEVVAYPVFTTQQIDLMTNYQRETYLEKMQEIQEGEEEPYQDFGVRTEPRKWVVNGHTAPGEWSECNSEFANVFGWADHIHRTFPKDKEHWAVFMKVDKENKLLHVALMKATDNFDSSYIITSFRANSYYGDYQYEGYSRPVTIEGELITMQNPAEAIAIADQLSRESSVAFYASTLVGQNNKAKPIKYQALKIPIITGDYNTKEEVGEKIRNLHAEEWIADPGDY